MLSLGHNLVINQLTHDKQYINNNFTYQGVYLSDVEQTDLQDPKSGK